MRWLSVLLLVFTTLLSHLTSIAQPIIQRQTGAIEQRGRIDENTRILDQTTGKPISYTEYMALMKRDANAYYLEPMPDEYGEFSAYKIRLKTADERATGQLNMRDPAQQPKVGEPISAFIMKGIDGNVYRSADLKSRVVILSFWVSLRKPFWSADQSKKLAQTLRPYQSETDPLVLGVVNDSKEELEAILATQTLPFIPIPNSYGFHKRYNVLSTPSFVVIDRAGNVAAYLEGPGSYERLQQVLQTVSR
ncbi:peroxiredoxin [Spirosoma lacussanchae]|uniref:TlpA family protein disulfide reductase n=1 Tax=Spirosoma lacussanchae TaxID=1884249 RepID=UPI0011091DC7|nr:redoxin domain-containing protein [Spirosoma lacussanchae]